jgi:hypothetical protein
MLARSCRFWLVAVSLLSIGAAMAADAPAPPNAAAAIRSPGSGHLTMCRSWLFFNTCRDYNRVALPERIALGDDLDLNFGTNPKDYHFPVARIVRKGDGCTLLDEPADAPDDGNRIEIASCADAAGPH